MTSGDFPDLRSFIRQLEAGGELQHVSRPVNPHTNLGALAWQGENWLGKSTFFHALEGFPEWEAISYAETSRKRLAMAMHTTVSEFIPTMRDLLKKGPTPFAKVDWGPVKEVIQVGDQIDLTKLPIHQHYEEDGGNFIGGGMLITKDPETGEYNSTLHRHHIFDKETMGILIHPGRHTDLNYKKAEALNKPLEFALAIGHHPMLVLCTTWTFPKDVYELDMAGTFLGQPVPMVKCETVDLWAPAHAEIIVEGYILPHDRHMEGPFTEHTGYARAGSGMNPYCKVTAITHRKKPIFYALQGGKPIASSQILDAIPQEIGIWERIKDVGGYTNVKDVVSLPYAGGSHIIVVQITPHMEGQAKDVLMAALSSQYVHPKIAIAVDDDIDPHDPKELFWSLSTRVDPRRDVFIIEGTRGHHLDASLQQITPPGVAPHIRYGSKMGIDATKPPTRDPDARSYFTRSEPRGMNEVRIQDFIDKTSPR